ncbi:TauD/TfdA family dioxygenase [Francisella sp. 19X1-34]|uniref:TauD/TfdA family dioxygenase n=1 Tax=Francisella sp. 19X1-34 TaxID=3087177 RepID=UPI002E303EDF|nr:TauD/TfdA family dioxygenase [Francisella sp. 19X1-34]MED7789588.1 TauD/TfdA family dioxygenase [Francisella sp. 19X1-34]
MKDILKNSFNENDISKLVIEYSLNYDDIQELKYALKNAKQTKKDLTYLQITDFPIPKLSSKILKFSEELENGLGIVKINKLPINEFSFDEIKVIFWGLGIYLGTPVSQSNTRQHMMSIKDLGEKLEGGKGRGPTTKAKLDLHTDTCDVVGLLCCHKAKHGGETSLASSIQAYHYISQNRPDLLDVLLKPFPYTRPNWDKQSYNNYSERPIFAKENGKLICQYIRPFIENKYNVDDNHSMSKLSHKQIEAMDYLDDVLNKLSWKFLLQPGEILFINNFTILHARSAFEDYIQENKKRLLLRLWLSMPNSRKLPESYITQYGRTAAGVLRGGIY